jgi:CheY-like chemotaxis protein
VSATAGDESLRLLCGAARRRDALPARVLMDLNTPGDDSRGAQRAICNEVTLKTLPLVVLQQIFVYWLGSVVLPA